MTTTLTKEPEFMYPTSRQFPFGEAVHDVVRALEERNWDVPGIEVTFTVIGSGNAKKRSVETIIGQDFKIRINPYNRGKGIGASDLWIPEKELSVYPDESGPNYCVYTGNDWEADRKNFVSAMKWANRQGNHDQPYVQYSGACNCRATQYRHTHPERRPPVLVVSNRFDYDYATEPGADVLKTDEVMQVFAEYFALVVMPYITQFPTKDAVDYFYEEPIALPEDLQPVFCFGDRNDARRVEIGSANPDKLTPSDQYGLEAKGYRLAPLTVRNDGTFPETAYEGFIWAGFGTVSESTPSVSLVVPGHYRFSNREEAVFRINLKRANHVYVAEHDAFEQKRTQLFDDARDESPTRDLLTDAEVNQAHAMRAGTIIPLHEYTTGLYKNPVVLINRELDLDEVELVIKPKPYRGEE